MTVVTTRLSRGRWLAICMATLYIVGMGTVYADTSSQQQLYELGIYYDNANGGDSCSASADTPITNSSATTTAQTVASNFIIGFDASTPKEVITDLATKYHIGGMYLTGTSDAASLGFTKQFYDSLEKASGSGMVISSDEEGVVTRYNYGSTSFPAAATMAKDSDSQVTAIGTSVGKVMADNGLTADLAPVLDLRDVGNGLTGRSFSSDPSVVADKAGAFTEGLKSSGIKPIFKHFPGFDSTTSGSTDDQKVVMKGSIAKTVAPYKTLLAKYPDAGVMLSNMYVSALDPANPSSMSPATVQYLRSTLNFGGLITTDDLSVSSVISKAGSLPKAVSGALDAGVTMPLFGLSAKTTSSAESELDQIIAAVQSDSAAMSAIQKNQSVVTSFKGGSSSTTNTSSTPNCCGTSSATLVGDDNESKTWNYFKGQGLDDMHTAAIMGNIAAESGFSPTIIEGGSTTQDPSNISVGWGLAQWTPGSKTQGLMDDAKITTPVYELGSQLQLIWYEMNHTTPVGQSDFMKPFLATTDISSATLYFETYFEGPKVLNGRDTLSEAALTKYGGKGSGVTATGSSSGSTSCSQGPPDCSSPTGITKIYCDAKAYDPATYSYGASPRDGPSWHKQCPTINSTCEVDCSLLVTLAVYDAFNVVLPGTDTAGERSDVGTYWKKISFDQLQTGDIIQPDPGHVEVVAYVSSDGTIYTFGAHMHYSDQSKDVSPSSYQNTADNLYLQYIGPGAS